MSACCRFCRPDVTGGQGHVVVPNGIVLPRSVDVDADVEPFELHVRRSPPTEALVVEVELAVDPGGQFAVRRAGVVGQDHVFQAVPPATTKDLPLVFGQAAACVPCNSPPV